MLLLWAFPNLKYKSTFRYAINFLQFSIPYFDIMLPKDYSIKVKSLITAFEKVCFD